MPLLQSLSNILQIAYLAYEADAYVNKKRSYLHKGCLFKNVDVIK